MLATHLLMNVEGKRLAVLRSLVKYCDHVSFRPAHQPFSPTWLIMGAFIIERARELAPISAH